MSLKMNGHEIDVSVVIPAYNRVHRIEASIRSVVAQTYPPREVIVVDDCSTDGTWQELKRIALALPVVRPIHVSENLGAQHARNVGVKAAHFPWIAFNDSDDIWVKDKLETQIEALQRLKTDPMVVIHSDMYRQDGEDGQLRYVPLPSFEEPGAFKKVLMGYGALFQTMLVSKTALEQIGYLDEKVPAYQEWETTIRLASICRFIHVSRPLFIWIRHGGETISGNELRGLAGYQYIIEKHGMDMVRQGGKRLYLRHLFLVALQFLAAGRQDLALACLEKSQVGAFSVKLSVVLMRHKLLCCLQKFLLRNFSRWQKLKICLFG